MSAPSAPLARLPWRVIGLALLLVLAFTAVIHLGPLMRMPADHVYLGYTQRDQITYYANAREIVERGHWLFYSNPYTHVEDSPAHYTHLGAVVTALLWRLGLPFIAIDQTLRIVFGTAFLVLWWGLARVFFRSRRLRIAATAIGWTGAGIAWIAAFRHVDTEGGYLEAFHFAEHSYDWWFYCLFRNLMYATECFYHALAFATLLLAARRRFLLACAALFLTWWAHPFTGLEVGAILSLFLLLTAIAERRPAAWAAFALSGAISVLFLLHITVILTQDPEHRSVMEQFESVTSSVYLDEIVKAHGLWIALALPWLFSRRASRWVGRTAAGRLWFAWLLAVGLLVINDRLPFNPRPLQASHFTRGYLHLPLLVAGLKGVQHLAVRLRATALRPCPWGLLLGLWLLVLPDNLMFVENHIRSAHRESRITTVPAASWEVVEFLGTVTGRHRVLVLERYPDHGIGYLIPTFTPHDATMGHRYNTPFGREKLHMVIEAWETGDLRPFRSAGFDIVVAPQVGLPGVFAGVPSEEIFANEAWRVTRLPE